MPFTLFTLSNICYFYRSIFLNAPYSHCLYEATFDVFIWQLSSTRRLAIDYIKQPLVFLSFNYPQRDVWPLFIWSNLCCFYRSIILNAPFDHCLYEATFVVFILQLSSTRRSAIDYIKQPLLFLSCNYPQRAGYPFYILSNLFLSFNYPHRAVWPLFIWSNLCCFYLAIILNAPFSHWLY